MCPPFCRVAPSTRPNALLPPKRIHDHRVFSPAFHSLSLSSTILSSYALSAVSPCQAPVSYRPLRLTVASCNTLQQGSLPAPTPNSPSTFPAGLRRRSPRQAGCPQNHSSWLPPSLPQPILLYYVTVHDPALALVLPLPPRRLVRSAALAPLVLRGTNIGA